MFYSENLINAEHNLVQLSSMPNCLFGIYYMSLKVKKSHVDEVNKNK